MADPNIVNPYEHIWKTRDLRALETPIELENNTSQFGRGLNAFGKEMQATGYGLAALGELKGIRRQRTKASRGTMHQMLQTLQTLKV